MAWYDDLADGEIRKVAKGVLGPAYEPANALFNILPEFSVGADFRDYRDFSANALNNFEEGNYVNGALDVASSVGSLAMIAAPGSLGMFGGVGAKTHDSFKLADAKKLAKKGVNKQKIWEDTGWFEDVDGNWKFEIDDSGAKYTPDNIPLETINGKDYKVGDLPTGLDHKDFFDAYPDKAGNKLVDYDFRNKDFSTGSFSPASEFMGSPDTINMWSGSDKRSTLLHEAQHAIQRGEGFATGGNSRMFETIESPIHTANPEKSARFKELRESAGSQAEIDASNKLWQDKYEPLWKNIEDNAETPGDFDKLDGVLTKFKEDTKGLFPIQDELDVLARELGNPKWSPDKQYKNLAGEAEARNVQTRRDFTPEQRAAQHPHDTLDVPMNELVVRTDGTGPMNAEVYQGGPHKYGPEGAKDSLNHMSKGEGVQAYGWGRYDAGNKAVADQYRRQLTVPERYVDGEVLDIYNPKHMLASTLGDEAGNIEEAGQTLKMLATRGGSDSIRKTAKDALDMLVDGVRPEIKTIKPDGHIYKHDLPDEDIARYMDWDKPLSEQPESVKEALVKAAPSLEIDGKHAQMNGENFMRLFGGLEQSNGSMVSRQLSEAGIPGLKYQDGGSRGLIGRVHRDGKGFRAEVGPPGSGGNGKWEQQYFDTEEAATTWLNQKKAGTSNYVTWGQDVLDRMTLLERNGEDMLELLPPRGKLKSAIYHNEEIYTGDTHLDALNKVPKDIKQKLMLDADNRGFVDHRGKFMDRYDAQKYAVKNRLFKDDAPEWVYTSPELIAENLRPYRPDILESAGGRDEFPLLYEMLNK